MNNIIPYNETYDLAKGLNSLKGEPKGTIFSNFTFEETASASGQQVDFGLDQIESAEQLYSSLGISVEASGSYGLFSASGKFEMAQESNFNSHSIFFLLKVRVKNAVKRIKNYELKPEALQMLSDGKTERFQRSFGDAYIEGIITGGEFFALYELVCTDESSKQKMSAELNVSAGGIGASFDLSASFSSAVGKASQKKNLKVVTYQCGGKGLSVVSNPEEIFARAKEFPKLVQDNAGVPYEVIKSSYETLALPEGPNFVDIENKKYVLDDYCKEIVDLRRKFNDLKYILLNPEEFEIDVTDPAQIAYVADQAKILGDIINEYTQHARTCADSITQCSAFVPTKAADLTRIPKRKNALDIVVLYDGEDYTGNAHYLTKGHYDTPDAMGGLANDSVKSIKVPQNFKAVLWEHWYYGGRNLPLTESVPKLADFNFANLASSIYITDTNDAKLKPENISAPVNPQPAPSASRFATTYKQLASYRTMAAALQLNK